MPEGMDDSALEARLFASESGAAPHRTRPLEEWGEVHRELRRPRVTLQLLWLEYRERHPDGY